MDDIRKASSVRGHRFLFVLTIAVLIGLLRPAPSFGGQARPERAVRPMAIDYTVRRLPAGDRYEITMRFRGDHSGRSTLTVPTRWAAAEHLERGIENLAMQTPGASMEDTDQPEVKRIVHRPDAMLTVRYSLKQIESGEPDFGNPAAEFLPVIRLGYFEWVGWATWVIPMADNDRRVRVHVAFQGLPSDWSFASSFGLDPATVRFDGPMDRFQAALFIGGDFRLRSRPSRGGPVVTAVRGDWSFGDTALADRVRKIVDGERAFWNDDSQRYFLIALLPLEAPASGSGYFGTGLTKAFMTGVAGKMTLDDLDGLWTHEYFHTWNNGQLGHFAEPQARLYWFSEGFTDYYTNLLQLRFGLESLERYAEAYDHAIEVLAGSPEGRATNDEVARRFFTDGGTYGRVPYYRGMLLAVKWDARIRAASAGRWTLDDAMRTLRDEHLHGVAMLDAARIVRVMRSYGVADAAADIETQIERGEIPRLADGLLTACISLDDATEPRVDIGFDLAGSTTGSEPAIAGVDPDGPAYAAGMRNGQRLRSFRSVDPSQHLVEAGFETTPESPITTVRYRALGRPIMRQHVAVRGGLDDATRSACLAALGVH